MANNRKNSSVSFRQFFPFYQKHKNLIFFDSAATTLKPKQVIAAIMDYYQFNTVHGGRSQFDLAYQVNQQTVGVRKQVAKFINANYYKSILFTAGATASLNDCAYYFSQINEPFVIIVGQNEHSSNLFPWVQISANNPQITIKFVDLGDNLTFTLGKLKKKFSADVRLVAINAVSNVFGKINEINKIGAFLASQQCLFLIDATQAIAHCPVNVTRANCDFLVFSGHKMFGPTGIGVLYVSYDSISRKGFPPFSVFQTGGGAINSVTFNKEKQHVKFNLKEGTFRYEPGTQNYAGIIGLGAAITFIESITYDTIRKHDKMLIRYFQNWVSQSQIAKHITVYSPNPDIPIFIFNIKGVFCQDVASYLNEHHICVRSGEHCVLLNEALPPDENKSVRISCSIYNDCDELDQLFRVLQLLISEQQKDEANIINKEFMMRQTIIDHYANPMHKKVITDKRYFKYYLKSDECIDEITIYLNFDFKVNVIADLKFSGSACSICITACDMLIQLIIHQELTQAIRIINEYRAMIQHKTFHATLIGDLICLKNTYKVPMRIKCATLVVKILLELFLMIAVSKASQDTA